MASCTLLRLSLRLVFAAYILHPQLSGVEPRVDTSVRDVHQWLTPLTLGTD